MYRPGMNPMYESDMNAGRYVQQPVNGIDAMNGMNLGVMQPVSGEMRDMSNQYQEMKDSKRKKTMYTEDVEELAHAVYIFWKAREMVKNKEFEIEEANNRAETMWLNENEDTRDIFKRAAVVQEIMLGNVLSKKKHPSKSDVSLNRANSNPFLLFCKDHRENVREKGSRGKGMTTLSQMWKDLPQSEKDKYIKLAKDNKDKETATDVPSNAATEVNRNNDSANQMNLIKNDNN